MKKCSLLLEKISCKAVCIMAAIILAAFSYWAGIYTHLINVDLVNLKIRLYEDSFIKNVIWFFSIVLVLFLISKMTLTKNEKQNKKRIHILAISAAVLAGVVSLAWAVINHYEPDHDQLQIVQDALDFCNGDYSDLKGYLEIFPYQIGLVHLYKILMTIFPNTESIYFIHAVLISVIVYFTYAITQEIFENNRAALYSIIGSVGFVPMYFYVNYAYGDLSMAACGILGVWCMIKFCKTKQIRYAVAQLIVMTIGYLARTNTLIILIAMCIVFFVYGISQKDWKMFLISVLIVCMPIMSSELLLNSYEKKANVEMLEGAPAVLTIAMGMQEAYEGPGYYNAYNLMVYVNSDKNADLAAKIGKEYISERMLELRQDLSYTKNFYLTKIWQQWNEPAFGGEVSTHTFDREPSALVNSIYYGSIQQFLRIFRNYYLFILYVGAFIAVIYKSIFEKNDVIWKDIILVIFIGGFLFSLLWESKSRYVMPYVAMLLPYGAYGIYVLQNMTENIFGKNKKKKVLK